MKQLFEDDSVKENPMGDDTKYSRAIRVPQYEPSNEKPTVASLYNTEKYKSLYAKIKRAHVSEEEKNFLKFAASRHIVFNYSKIADYYANADKEMQELMEESALVILDMDDAIANGYVALSAKMRQLIEEEKERDANAREARKVLKAQRELFKEKMKEEENREIRRKKEAEAESVKEAMENALDGVLEDNDELPDGFMELPDED